MYTKIITTRATYDLMWCDGRAVVNPLWTTNQYKSDVVPIIVECGKTKILLVLCVRDVVMDRNWLNHVKYMYEKKGLQKRERHMHRLWTWIIWVSRKTPFVHYYILLRVQAVDLYATCIIYIYIIFIDCTFVRKC